MTNLSAAVNALDNESGSLPCSVLVPRINLRKRPISNTSKANLGLETVNSAFLTGLFADVAMARGEVQSNNNNSSTATFISANNPIEDEEHEQQQPCKKTRLSRTKSLSRCARSYKTIHDAIQDSICSPSQANTDYFDYNTTTATRQDSLQFQLHHVGSTDTSSTIIAFPDLPQSNTVSSSSEATTNVDNTGSNPHLTRVVSDLQSSVDTPTTEEKESYGWFVEMDDSNIRDVPSAYATTTDLAFSAPTAPKVDDNQDAEVEWAQAADTVDDVLGDFF